MFHKMKYKKLYKKIYKDRSDKKEFLFDSNEEIIEYELSVVELLLFDVIQQSRKLLHTKGFSTDLDDCMIEKHVFLFSEVGELTDCVKKGNRYEEPFEVADIIIRACGYLSSDQFYDCMNSIHTIAGAILHPNEFIQIRLPVSHDITQKKLLYINYIYTKCFEVRNIAQHTNKDNRIQVLNLWSKVIELYCYCSSYCSEILGLSLKSAIDLKMKENFRRPFKYNTKGLK